MELLGWLVGWLVGWLISYLVEFVLNQHFKLLQPLCAFIEL
jgi:hypothetical protein